MKVTPPFHILYGNKVEKRLVVLFMTELNGSVEAWSEFDLVAAEQVSTSAAVPHNV